MSFRAMQAVIDSWQRSGDIGEPSRMAAWSLLAWIARNSDNGTLTCTRSQIRLAQELRRSTSYVEKLIRHWRDVGVLKVRGRGGGRERKPNLYALDLVALQIHSDRRAALVASNQAGHPGGTPALHAVRENPVAKAIPHSSSEGVSSPTSTLHTVREKELKKPIEGVAPQLPHSNGGPSCQLPHSRIAASSDLSESDLKNSDMAPSRRRTQEVLNGKGPRRKTESQEAIDKRIATMIRLQPTCSDQEISRCVSNAKPEDVKRVRRDVQ